MDNQKGEKTIIHKHIEYPSSMKRGFSYIFTCYKLVFLYIIVKHDAVADLAQSGRATES